MHQHRQLPNVEVGRSVHAAVATFLLCWAVFVSVLLLGRAGLLPTPLMDAIDLVFVDVFYRTGYELWMATAPSTHPQSMLGFVVASSVGYGLLAALVGAWHYVYRAVSAEQQ